MPLLSDSLRTLASSLTIAALVIAGLVFGRDILVPLTIAILMAFVLAPIVFRLSSWGIPRSTAVIFTVFMVTSLVGAFTVFISREVLELTSELGTYRANIVEKVRDVTSPGSGGGTLTKASDAVEEIGEAIRDELDDDVSKKKAMRQVEVTGGTPTIVVAPAAQEVTIMEYAPLIAQPLAQGGLALLFTIFLMLQYKDLRDRVVRLFGTDHMSDTTSAMSEAGTRLSQVFLSQAVLNGSFGVFVGIALWIIGVPSAVLWGVVALFMRFVPFVGSVFAAVPPLMLAAAVDPGWTMFLATLAVFVIGEPLMGHVIEPLVLGKRAGISPFAMIAAASFWTLVWGPVGLLLAAPLTLALVVVGRYIAGLEFLSILLGDEPALSPEQEFYHRLLSEDSVAAVERFETALDEQSIGAVADGLVLPALRLAAYDQRLGRLDKEQVGDISSTMKQLIETSELGRPEAAENLVPVQNPARVLVVAARGPVDEEAAKFTAGLVELAQALSVTRAAEATGLTALASAKSLEKDAVFDTILIVSAGGLDTRHLLFIARRAEKDFPQANILVLDFRRASEPKPQPMDNLPERIAILHTVSETLLRLGCARRKDDQVVIEFHAPSPTATPAAGNEAATALR